MKCKSCGKVVANDAKICEYCGFDLEEYKKLKKVVVEVDPEIDNINKTNLVDYPILAFIFGLLAVITSILFVVSPAIVILYFLFVVLFNYLTFTLVNKPAKIKLKPIAMVGKGMAYFSIGFILLKVIFEIIGILFFK